MTTTVRVRVVPSAPVIRARVTPASQPLQAALRNTGSQIQWRIGQDGAWQDLIEVEDLRGPSGTLESVVDGTGIDVDATDPANPEVSLDSATLTSLGKADTAVQPANNLLDLANVLTARANLKIVVLDETAYAALSPPDADTIYHVVADA